MNRQDTISELAALCRQHPYIALAVVGWLTAAMDQEQLAQALEWAREARREWVPMDGHMALVEERYGPRRPLG